ncbi:MAG: hypothetical protein LBP65_00510 [Puniceicoccales bacterium]|jgi:hypothetical protein|nr:hypothetical protein [Puniceicoccales bacterium]
MAGIGGVDGVGKVASGGTDGFFSKQGLDDPAKTQRGYGIATPGKEHVTQTKPGDLQGGMGRYDALNPRNTLNPDGQALIILPTVGSTSGQAPGADAEYSEFGVRSGKRISS